MKSAKKKAMKESRSVKQLTESTLPIGKVNTYQIKL